MSNVILTPAHDFIVFELILNKNVSHEGLSQAFITQDRPERKQATVQVSSGAAGGVLLLHNIFNSSQQYFLDFYAYESRQTGAKYALPHPETNTVLLFLRVMRFAHMKTHTCITLTHTCHTHTHRERKGFTKAKRHLSTRDWLC